MLRIHLLGHLQILVDGSQWKLTARPKTLPLWAYLLLHRAGPVSREAVTFTLWPDETETAARANLRRHLHGLQRKLPPASPNQPWLLVDAAEVQWNPAADFWLDVAEFERLSSEDGSLAGAVALYAGDLLQDVYEDWLFYERERLRALYQADLAQLIRIGRSCGDYARAIAWAQQLLRHDPLHEDAMRQLLALRYESGDRTGAVAEYHRFVQLLRQELGVDPMPETAALYEAIVRSARLPGAVVIPPSLPGGEAETQPGRGEDRSRRVLPFAGRGPEMEQLRVAWSRAARGHGSLVLVGGEAGVGKTRLAAELAAAAESQGARVLVGGTTFAEPMPYQAVIEALHSVLPLLATPSLPRGHLSAVAPLLPELKARLPDLPPPAPAGRGARTGSPVRGAGALPGRAGPAAADAAHPGRPALGRCGDVRVAHRPGWTCGPACPAYPGHLPRGRGAPFAPPALSAPPSASAVGLASGPQPAARQRSGDDRAPGAGAGPG